MSIKMAQDHSSWCCPIYPTRQPLSLASKRLCDVVSASKATSDAVYTLWAGIGFP